MEYYFDDFGWLSDEPKEGRVTEVPPPEHRGKVIGSLYPNFTGIEWVMASYSMPVVAQPGNSILTPLEFINRLTDQEAKNIIALSKTNPDVELWWIKYNKASYINLQDPQAISGIQALEYMTVIGQGRAREILNF
jgi:hypothetical protein